MGGYILLPQAGYMAEHSTHLQSVLTFREVMDFRTSARLVVPSACEFGWERRAAARASSGSLEQAVCRGGSWPANGVSMTTRLPEVKAALLALLGHASGLPTQFRIGLSSRPIRGSCETREVVRGNQVTS